MPAHILRRFGPGLGWERALYAFLMEKQRRSGSRRTVEGFSRMIQNRLWVQILDELEALQAHRRAERTPLARFDFSATPP